MSTLARLKFFPKFSILKYFVIKFIKMLWEACGGNYENVLIRLPNKGSLYISIMQLVPGVWRLYVEEKFKGDFSSRQAAKAEAEFEYLKYMALHL